MQTQTPTQVVYCTWDETLETQEQHRKLHPGCVSCHNPDGATVWKRRVDGAPMERFSAHMPKVH